MNTEQTAGEALAAWLKSNGYDGLFCDDGPCGTCGCTITDLAPCNEYCLECKPAYKRACTKCPNSGDCETESEMIQYVSVSAGRFCLHPEKLEGE